MNKNNRYNYIEDYLIQVMAMGRYLFSFQELQEIFNTSSKAIEDSLYRLKKKKKIASVKKGFYVILTPEYQSIGILHPNLFMDDLMREMKKAYYVGLYSAAELHGASHQKPQEYYVITKAPAIRRINLKSTVLNFCVKKDWNQEDIVDIKTDAGYIKVSSPELTALDLMYYQNIVSINRSYTILQELNEVMKYSKLLSTSRRYIQPTSIQRLGYLLDRHLGLEKLSSALYSNLQGKNIGRVLLSTGNDKVGEIDKKWNVIVNTEIEGDL